MTAYWNNIRLTATNDQDILRLECVMEATYQLGKAIDLDRTMASIRSAYDHEGTLFVDFNGDDTVDLQTLLMRMWRAVGESEESVVFYRNGKATSVETFGAETFPGR